MDDYSFIYFLKLILLGVVEGCNLTQLLSTKYTLDLESNPFLQ